jgi:hypothetical protein
MCYFLVSKCSFTLENGSLPLSPIPKPNYYLTGVLLFGKAIIFSSYCFMSSSVCTHFFIYWLGLFGSGNIVAFTNSSK